jgi:hypothetical protein
MRATIVKVSYRCKKGLDAPKVAGQFAGTGSIQVFRSIEGEKVDGVVYDPKRG